MQNVNLVPLRLPNGVVIKMEARTSGETDVGALKALVEPIDPDVIGDAICGIAELVKDAISKVKPQKVTAEFSIELGCEAGKLTSLIVGGSSKGGLKIGLEWGGIGGGTAQVDERRRP